MRILVPVVILAIISQSASQRSQGAPQKPYIKRCFFGMPCWPQAQDILNFLYSLKGELILPSDSRYPGFCSMRNVRYTKSPGFIVMVTSQDDIRKSMLFARKHNLLVTIRSSGHSFVGRSAHDGSLLINMQNMKKISVNLTSTRSEGGEVTVESGNTWSRVYQEVDKFNRVVVGGSAPTVAMGGYTQGGGHSPLSRSLGLAVDNLLEAQLVTSDGKIVKATENEALVLDPETGAVLERHNGDLFWALRGGGGGTWGVVVSFTFKLHVPPPQLVHLNLGYTFYKSEYVGRPIVDYFFKMLPSLPKEWGGYFIFTTWPNQLVIISLLHYGEWNTASREAIQPLLDQSQSIRQWSNFTNHSTFWSYEKGVREDPASVGYLINTFIQEETISSGLSDFFIDMKSPPDLESAYICTGTLIGGQVKNVTLSATAINPNFRSSLMSMSCALGWTLTNKNWTRKINAARAFGRKLQTHGRGVYFNEPGADLPDWKTQFWGNNYGRLLQIKQKWDPGNFLWCHNCVGDDPIPTPASPTCGVSSTAPSLLLTMVVSLVLALLK